jgi:hypothetical protein
MMSKVERRKYKVERFKMLRALREILRVLSG